MNFDDKISKIIENQKIKKRLTELGIYSIQGPTGPKGNDGTSLKILASYNTEEEFIKEHPQGKEGDCYIVDRNLYIWNSEKSRWDKSNNIQGPTGPKGDTGPRGLPGEIGISEVIEIDNTETIEAGEEAVVEDDFDQNTHHLTFYIPKGEKGDIGPQGEIGPTGPKGSLGPTSYDAVAFASFLDTQEARTAQIGTRRIIPGLSKILSMPNNTDIIVSETGAFEITLCGRISGVTQDVGASFSLTNSTTNEVLSDLIFELNAGNTPDMDFSETNIVDIHAPATLHLETKIDDTQKSANIKFTYMNVLIKSYHL